MFNVTSLCAGSFKYYIADILLILFFAIYITKGARKGFFGCVFGVISTLAAVILAIITAEIVVSLTGGLFGLQESAYNKFYEVFSGWEGFNVDISGMEVDEALAVNTMPAIVAKLILKITGRQDVLTEGSTLAQLISEATSSLLVLICTGILIFIVIKLVFFILRKILSNDPDDIDEDEGLVNVNTLLGGVLGCVSALLIVSVILAVLAVFPFKALTGYLSNTLLVGKLYVHNPLIYILGLFL